MKKSRVCAFVQGIKRVYGFEHVCLSSSLHYLVDSYLRVHVIEVLLKIRKKAAPQDACVLVYAIKHEYGCVYVCMSVVFTSLSSRELLVCVCIYIYVNTAERL